MRASWWPLCFVFIVDLLARSFPVILVGPLQTCKLCLTIFGMETIMGVAELLQNVWRTIMVCGQIWNNGSWVLTWKTIYLNQNIFHKSLRRCLQRQSYWKNIHPPGGLLVNKCRQNILNKLIFPKKDFWLKVSIKYSKMEAGRYAGGLDGCFRQLQ